MGLWGDPSSSSTCDVTCGLYGVCELDWGDKEGRFVIMRADLYHSVPECGSETLKCYPASAHIWDLPIINDI